MWIAPWAVRSRREYRSGSCSTARNGAVRSGGQASEPPSSTTEHPDSGRKKGAGDYLLSHAESHAVPSAMEDLTAEFGMESGVAPPV